MIESTEMVPTTIFYHVWLRSPRWKELVFAQLARLSSSGLYDNCTNLFICGIGDLPSRKELEEVLKHYPKATILDYHEEETFELATLQMLQNYAKSNLDNNILYIHTKGVTYNRVSVDHWRLCMEYFCIDHYKECLDLLNTGADMVGVNLFPKPMVHYSGNFWWTRASYIATLGSMELKSGNPRKSIHPRMCGEFWPVSGVGNFECLYYSRVNHYLDPHHPVNYTAKHFLDHQDTARETRAVIWAEAGLPAFPGLTSGKAMVD